MKCIKTGNLPEKNSDTGFLRKGMKSGQILFVDMWGNYSIYEREYSLFHNVFKKYIEDKKYNTRYFNENYIVEIYKKCN